MKCIEDFDDILFIKLFIHFLKKGLIGSVRPIWDFGNAISA